jgi:hypothetical protein
MEKYDTSSFISAYTRFAARFGHPRRLFPDEGSQLIKGCKEMCYSYLDASKYLSAEYNVGFDFEACSVAGHSAHGQVERSIKSIRNIFNALFPVENKLSILSYETAFSFISNELNNLPLARGKDYRDLGHLDLLTPNRLIMGRNNRRSMSDPCSIESPGKILQQMEDIFYSW